MTVRAIAEARVQSDTEEEVVMGMGVRGITRPMWIGLVVAAVVVIVVLAVVFSGGGGGGGTGGAY